MEALRDTFSGIAPKDFSVRIGQDEMGLIFSLKANIDFDGILREHAAQYRKLGWHLVALGGMGREEMALDFGEPEEVWSKRLTDLSLAGTQVNLGVKSGFDSRLLVLEVAPESAAVLDNLGKWRAVCVAQGEGGREQHYYALPPGRRLPASGPLTGFKILVFGEGEVVLAPPSRESRDADPWQWLAPPWESPPRPPAPGVCAFLSEHAGRSPTSGEVPEILAWKEIYHLISPYEEVLRALLAPAASQEEYYQKVLGAALGAGLEDYEVLRGLLWHSPQGDFKSRPEGLAYLHEVVSNSTQIKDSKLNQRSFMEELEARVHSDQIEVLSRVSLPRDNRPQVFLKPLPPNGPGAGPSSWPELNEPEEAALRETQASDDKDYPTFLEDPSFRESTLLDRTNYEGLLHELGKLTNVVDELKHHMVGREGALEPESGKAHKRLGEAGESLSPGLPGKGAKAMNHQDDMDQPTEEQAQLRDFMEHNSDLASDPRKVQIVEYCLKNYININRELAGLPIRAKLEKAGEIARNFLKGSQ